MRRARCLSICATAPRKDSRAAYSLLTIRPVTQITSRKIQNGTPTGSSAPDENNVRNRCLSVALFEDLRGQEGLYQVVAFRLVAELSFPEDRLIDLVLRGSFASIGVEHV
jgi:hypothetical protein